MLINDPNINSSMESTPKEKTLLIMEVSKQLITLMENGKKKMVLNHFFPDYRVTLQSNCFG